MTTATVPRSLPPVRLAFSGLLRSELIKLTSLRSIRYTAIVSVLLVIAGMVLRAWSYAPDADPGGAGISSLEAWRMVIGTGLPAAEIPVVVLAVLVAGSEYVNRAVLQTFVAAPRRLPVLAAKTLVAVATVAVVVGLGVVIGAIASLPLMHAAHLAGPTPEVIGTAVSEIVLLAVYATFALLTATLLRSTAGAITVVLAVLLVLPVGIGLLSTVTGTDLLPYVFSYAASMTTAAIDQPSVAHELGRALPVTLAWLLAPGAAAVAALLRRDV
jgi:ABC-2 type transport system permease protein